MSATAPAPVEPSAASPGGAAGTGEGLGAYARRWWTGVRAGDLGSLPIVVGLVLIAVIFQAQNSQFLTAGNLVNLMVQAAAYTTIAMGVVFVLLLGEIDLSIGYVSGVAGCIVALLTLPGGKYEYAAGPALLLALLAGLLGWNGVVLLLIGNQGTVIIQSTFLVGFANDFIPKSTAWILAILTILFYAGLLFFQRTQRRRAGLDTVPDSLLALRVAGLAIAAIVVVYVANQDRGVPYVFLVLAGLYLFWTYVLNRTRFGRHVYAVGGNQEAARRAGINVDRVKIACFAICSMMAALGGVVLASRLRSVDTGAGGGSVLLYSIAAAVIGGTSLFGGRGHVKSAILGALVITSIDNGLGLLGLSAGTKFIVTGLVLLAAVTVDSLSRRGRESAGRA
jgi:D-xylose transport system permease protein